ncbi:MAG: PatB family C-S lyase [Bacteroidales bacterium]|nr:PatB family C-S lyase [Bacteroidales bacterium]
MIRYDFDRVIDRKGTNSVKYDLAGRLFGKEDVLPMWVADMDFPVAGFILDAIGERLKHPILGYTFRSDRFAGSVASWLDRRHGWRVETDTIGFSPGIVPALNMCVMEFTDPGDRVVVQPPVYFPFFSAVSNHGRELVYNQLVKRDGRYEMDFDHLEGLFKEGVKLFFLCNPHNPVGRAWSLEELQQLAGLCVKYDVLVLSDEIHSDLLLFGNRHIPFASLGKDIADLTLTCVAPSKTFNLAGLYTSVMITTNPVIRKRYEKILDAVHVGGDNILGQVALEAAYTDGDEWLDQLLVYLEKNYRALCSVLNEQVPDLFISPLEATYLAWLDFSFLELDDEGLRNFIIHRAGLGLNDGPMFGPGGSQHQRLNLATPTKILMEGAGRLATAVREA